MWQWDAQKKEAVRVPYEKLKMGDKVYHRNLCLKGVVVEPPFLGVDEGYTELVEFEDGETREVSIHLLDKI